MHFCSSETLYWYKYAKLIEINIRHWYIFSSSVEKMILKEELQQKKTGIF